jgi:hypothetical protein
MVTTHYSFLRRATVSKFFWLAVKDSFPGLQKDPAYPALFWYLLFGQKHDIDTHRLLLSAETLSAIEGRSPQNTQAEKFLERFRNDVLPQEAQLVWNKKWSHRD